MGRLRTRWLGIFLQIGSGSRGRRSGKNGLGLINDILKNRHVWTSPRWGTAGSGWGCRKIFVPRRASAWMWHAAGGRATAARTAPSRLAGAAAAGLRCDTIALVHPGRGRAAGAATGAALDARRVNP